MQGRVVPAHRMLVPLMRIPWSPPRAGWCESCAVWTHEDVCWMCAGELEPGWPIHLTQPHEYREAVVAVPVAGQSVNVEAVDSLVA